MSNVSITIELTEVQYKALSCACANVYEWVDNAATARALVAYDEIIKVEVERMLKDPTVQTIPADKDSIVMNAASNVLMNTNGPIFMPSSFQTPPPPS